MRGKQDPASSVITFLPLTTEGRYEHSGPLPHLFVAKALGYKYYGELVISDGRAIFAWDPIVVDWTSKSDLLDAPLRSGRNVRIEGYYDQATAETFVVLDMNSL